MRDDPNALAMEALVLNDVERAEVAQHYQFLALCEVDQNRRMNSLMEALSTSMPWTAPSPESLNNRMANLYKQHMERKSRKNKKDGK